MQDTKIYPLRRLMLGVWESSLHIDGQIFMMVPPSDNRKLIFLAVHPAPEISSPSLNQALFIQNLSELTWHWQKNKKRLLKLFGNRNPFSQQLENKTDFYGVVAFELKIDDIGGFECTNSLIKDFSRLVFEAKNLIKLCFNSVEEFFIHYDLPQFSLEHKLYVPTLVPNQNLIEVKTAFQQTQSSLKKSDSYNSLTNSPAPAKSGWSLTPNQRQRPQVLFQTTNKTPEISLSCSLIESSLIYEEPNSPRSPTTRQLTLRHRKSRSNSPKGQQPQLKKKLSEKLKESQIAINQLKHQTEKILEEGSCDQEESSEEPMNEDTIRLKSITTGGTDISSAPDTTSPIEMHPINKIQTIQTLSGLTLIAHFEDPGVSIAFKDILTDPANKKLLRQYEASLPSWTVVVAQYTGYYRPWQRKILRVIVFLASCITLTIGLYDLYQHFPVFRNFLTDQMKEWTSWFGEIIYIRTTLLMGHIIYFSSPIWYFFDYFFQTEASLVFLSNLLYPVFYLLKSIKAILTIFYELILPIQALICLILRSGISLVLTTLKLPFVVLKLGFQFLIDSIILIASMFQSIFSMLQQFGSFFSSFFTLVQPIGNNQNRETTITFFQILTQLCLDWSTSLTKRVIQAAKIVYDFVVYIFSELGKHNYTIKKAAGEKLGKLAHKTDIIAVQYHQKQHYLLRIAKVLLYIFLAIFLFNFIYIILREKFGLRGCVLCDEVTELVQTRTNQFVQQQIKRGLMVKKKSLGIGQQSLYFILRQLESLHGIIKNYLF